MPICARQSTDQHVTGEEKPVTARASWREGRRVPPDPVPPHLAVAGAPIRWQQNAQVLAEAALKLGDLWTEAIDTLPAGRTRDHLWFGYPFLLLAGNPDAIYGAIEVE